MEKNELSADEKRARLSAVIEILKKLYPEATCSLAFDGAPWRLLVMARLSAQCTDERVNRVSVELFRQYPSPEAMARADFDALCALVRPCGLYRTKAESIRETSRLLCERHNGRVPDSMEELLALPGVGRKIANLILGDVYGIPGIVADTHCIRINGRLGFYDESVKDPVKTERVLSTLVPPEEQTAYCHRMVLFGREYCTARAPRCRECPIAATNACLHAELVARDAVDRDVAPSP